MEKRDSQTTSFASLASEQRGAGGKLRKPPSRRPLATPYARPPQNQEQRGRWLSKLVDPAFRLIAGGANLIFPSFFSKSPSVNALPFPSAGYGWFWTKTYLSRVLLFIDCGLLGFNGIIFSWHYYTFYNEFSFIAKCGAFWMMYFDGSPSLLIWISKLLIYLLFFRFMGAFRFTRLAHGGGTKC